MPLIYLFIFSFIMWESMDRYCDSCNCLYIDSRLGCDESRLQPVSTKLTCFKFWLRNGEDFLGMLSCLWICIIC